jgi:hypothetical protein
LITRPEASFSVKKRSPIFADKQLQYHPLRPWLAIAMGSWKTHRPWPAIKMELPYETSPPHSWSMIEENRSPAHRADTKPHSRDLICHWPYHPRRENPSCCTELQQGNMSTYINNKTHTSKRHVWGLRPSRHRYLQWSTRILWLAHCFLVGICEHYAPSIFSNAPEGSPCQSLVKDF